MIEYTPQTRKQILTLLDGWIVYSPTTEQGNEEAEEVVEVEPFITDYTEYKNNPNKRITDEELQTFYYQAYNKSLLITNRFNIEDLTSTETEYYLQGVHLLTASDIWNKYNIRVNNEDMEDTYIQSYGGLLYKQSINILNSFINQRITTITSIKKHKNNCTEWII